jgi:hypothetical protein
MCKLFLKQDDITQVYYKFITAFSEFKLLMVMSDGK